ncbi:MAG: hypothetical protein WCD89_18695 [Anaerocolumna sp.]
MSREEFSRELGFDFNTLYGIERNCKPVTDELSSLKTHLVKLVLCVEDHVIDDVFSDLNGMSNYDMSGKDDSIQQLTMSYMNELNSEKKQGT